jgi:hemerythrin superfamily protein
MLKFLTRSSTDAINLIKKDHDKVKELFKAFDAADNLRDRRKIVAETLQELKLHAAVEEELFYPAVRKSLGKDMMTEADEEHHVAKILIAELDLMSGKEAHYCAKYNVLAECVRHHIKEEEGEMLPAARDLDLDMEELGNEMIAFKEEMMNVGLDLVLEEKMVALMKGVTESYTNKTKK